MAENTIKIVVSTSFQTGQNTQKLAKMLSQNLVQGWVKTWSKYVAQQNWTKFWLKKWCFFCFLLVFFKISFSLQKEEDFWKTNKEKKKTWTKFSQKKAIFGPSFDYIYIYQPYMRLLPGHLPTFFVVWKQKHA